MRAKVTLSISGVLVEVDRLLAAAATLGSTEGRSAAMRAIIALLFLLYPPFSADFPPSGDASQDDLLADGNGEIIDESAGELVTLVASFYIFVKAARLDRADPAVSKDALREAAVAYYVFGFGAVNRSQLLFEFIIVVPARYVDSTDPAIQAAWRCQFLINGHDITPPVLACA